MLLILPLPLPQALRATAPGIVQRLLLAAGDKAAPWVLLHGAVGLRGGVLFLRGLW